MRLRILGAPMPPDAVLLLPPGLAEVGRALSGRAPSATWTPQELREYEALCDAFESAVALALQERTAALVMGLKEQDI